jgi:hypothetical protein
MITFIARFLNGLRRTRRWSSTTALCPVRYLLRVDSTPTHDSQRSDRSLCGRRLNPSGQCLSGLIPSRTYDPRRTSAGLPHHRPPQRGLGKDYFALKYLPRVTPGTAFVNADLIAAGLSPLAPEQQLFTASPLLVQRLRSAGRIVLPCPSERRVVAITCRRARGARGPSNCTGRYSAALPAQGAQSAHVYAGAVDDAFCLLNSGPSPEFVFVQQGEKRTILLQPVYEDLVKAAMR